MTRAIAVTGFAAFAQHTRNISGEIALELGRSNPALHVEVLPTAYARAGARIEALIDIVRPRALVMLGLAASATALRFERRAANRDHATLRDTDHEQRLERTIVSGAEPSYASTLPLERFALRVQALGSAYEFSDCAGGFVCNHVFYRAAHCIVQNNLQIACGFVHVPPSDGATLEPWCSALAACLEVLEASLD